MRGSFRLAEELLASQGRFRPVELVYVFRNHVMPKYIIESHIDASCSCDQSVTDVQTRI